MNLPSSGPPPGGRDRFHLLLVLAMAVVLGLMWALVAADRFMGWGLT